MKYDTTGSDKIALMGLWDAVEAFKLDKKEETSPREDHLNQIINVNKIFHAVSLDDNRSFVYTPVLINDKRVLVDSLPDFKNKIEEVWFSGSHRDIGGGPKDYPEISTISLNWMLTKINRYNLFLDTNLVVYTFARPHNASKSFFMRVLTRQRNRSLDQYFHNVPGDTNSKKIKVHRSVIQRLEEGVVPDFKNGKKRTDWYDLPPFNACFKPIGKKRVFQNTCSCIEVVE